MRILGELPDGRAIGPMPRWQRWLCAALLAITAPLWAPALLLAAACLALRGLFTKSPTQD